MTHVPLRIRLQAKNSSTRAIPVVARSLRTNLLDVRDAVEKGPIVIEIVISMAPIGGARNYQIDGSVRQRGKEFIGVTDDDLIELSFK